MQQIINFLTRKEEKPWKDTAVLLVIFGTAIFQFLGRMPLLEPDEGRYSEIAREMLEKMDFITPHLNYVKYFEKPPLLYWLNALSLSVFGNNEFAARFPTALAGLFGILLTYHIGRKIFGRREALFSALVLGTSVGYLAQARMNIIDMTLTFCMTATLGFFLTAVQDGEKRQGLYFHLFYLTAALTVLAKGVIGVVLPGGIIFLYIVITRKWRIFREMRLLTGVPLFLLVCAPWFIMVSVKNPEFARFFFIHEHLERFLTRVHGRYQPPWYFIPVLFGCMFPWSLFLPAAVRRLRHGIITPAGASVLFLTLWVVVIFGFFSLSDSKLIPYILPVFPAVALLVGRTFSLACEEGEKTLRVDSLGTALVAIIIGLGAFLYPVVAHRPKLGVVEVGVMGSILVIGGIAASMYSRKTGFSGFFVVLCLMSFLLTIAGPQFIFGNLARRKATPGLARLIKQKYEAGASVVSYNWYQQGLPFYSGQRVIVVGNWGELDFGRKQGDNTAWFLDYPTFNRLWDSPSRLFVLIQKPDLDKLRHHVKTPVTILGQKGDKFLIANR
jgi:4-amino-4-deoxy-L-arabinose transferase-like glycosyltransferase